MNHRGAKSPVPPEIALANDVFDQFCAAGSMKTILGHYRHLCDLLSVKPTNYPQFYPKLKLKLKSWKAQALWNKFDKRASHKCYNRGKACSNHRVLIIGAGPCGLRAAIEAQLLGAKVVVLEKRDRFSRNNVLHLWPFVIHDLKSLGAKKFFGKFCAGSIDHISIRQLQCILMKVALILGVEIHEGVGFESLLAPPSTQDAEKIGWRAVVSPPEHPVSQYEFNVLVGADGKRNTLEGFKRKEFRGKLAIAITANFINKKSEAEARVEEISGVAFIFNQKFFKDLYAETGIDLENIVYYKDDTHYFVMTAKKQSLLDKGVILQDYNDTARLLSQDNIDKEALKGYARQAANFSTDYQLPALEYAVNHYGQPDVAMFDFTSMYAAENASRYCERHGHRLLMTLVGDSLLEPFWPTGSGCARGFLSSMDACWAIRSWAQGNLNPLEVLAERESIYRILGQTTPENLHRDHAAYSLDPATRYPNLNPRSVLPGQVRGLYDTDEPATLEMYLRAPAAAAAASAQDTPKKRRRREAQVHPDILLFWLKQQVADYETVHITDLTSSFKDGLALCAVIHRYRPDLCDFPGLRPEEVRGNNQLAFDILEKELGIPPIMTGAEMEEADLPDQVLMESYLSQLYETFRREIPHIQHPPLPEEDIMAEAPRAPVRRDHLLGSVPSRHRLTSGERSDLMTRLIATPSGTASRKRASPAGEKRPVGTLLSARDASPGPGHNSSLSRSGKARKRRSGALPGTVAARKDTIEQIARNREERLVKHRSQRERDTRGFIKSMQMLTAYSRPESDESHATTNVDEDYGIFMYRQTAPDFKDRVKDIEKLIFHPEREVRAHSGIKMGALEEDISGRVRNLEEKFRGGCSPGMKPKDLYRAIGKIEKTDWNVKEIEKKIEENKYGRSSKAHSERVPKWSRQQFDDKFSAVERKLRKKGFDEAAASKFAQIDQSLKQLERKMKEGSALERGQRGSNKVSAMAAQLATRTQPDGPDTNKLPAKPGSKPVPPVTSQSGSELCHFCSKRVYLMERMNAEGRFFHRGCFRCEYCAINLRLGNYAFDREGKFGHRFFCSQHFGLAGTMKMRARRHEEPVPSPRRGVARTPEAPATPPGKESPVPPPVPKTPDMVALTKEELSERDGTPERIEIEVDGDEMPSVMDEDEWTDRNFGASCAENNSSDESSDEDDVEYSEALDVPLNADETLRLAEDWTRRYGGGGGDEGSEEEESGSEADGTEEEEEPFSYQESDSEDEESTATEGEEEIKAREMRKQEVFLQVPDPALPTDSDTEVGTEYTSSEESEEENSATEISTDSEFERDDTTPRHEVPDIVIGEPVQARRHVLPALAKLNGGPPARAEPPRELHLQPLVTSDFKVPPRPLPLMNPNKGDYGLNKTQSTEGIACKLSLELKKKYLFGAPDGGSSVRKSGSTSILDTKFKSFVDQISEAQKLLNPAPEPSVTMQAFLQGADKLKATPLVPPLPLIPAPAPAPGLRKALTNVEGFPHVCERGERKAEGGVEGEGAGAESRPRSPAHETSIIVPDVDLSKSVFNEKTNNWEDIEKVMSTSEDEMEVEETPGPDHVPHADDVTDSEATLSSDEVSTLSSYDDSKAAKRQISPPKVEVHNSKGELLLDENCPATDPHRVDLPTEVVDLVQSNLIRNCADRMNTSMPDVCQVPLQATREAGARSVENLSTSGDGAEKLSTNGDTAKNLSTNGDTAKNLSKNRDLAKNFSTNGDIAKTLSSSADVEKNSSSNSDIAKNLSTNGDIARGGFNSKIISVPGGELSSSVLKQVSHTSELCPSTPGAPGRPDSPSSPLSDSTTGGGVWGGGALTETELSDWARDEEPLSLGMLDDSARSDRRNMRNVTLRRHQKPRPKRGVAQTRGAAAKIARSEELEDFPPHVCGKMSPSNASAKTFPSPPSSPPAHQQYPLAPSTSLVLTDVDHIEFMDTGNEEDSSTEEIVPNRGYVQFVNATDEDNSEVSTPVAVPYRLLEVPHEEDETSSHLTSTSELVTVRSQHGSEETLTSRPADPWDNLESKVNGATAAARETCSENGVEKHLDQPETERNTSCEVFSVSHTPPVPLAEVYEAKNIALIEDVCGERVPRTQNAEPLTSTPASSGTPADVCDPSSQAYAEYVQRFAGRLSPFSNARDSIDIRKTRRSSKPGELVEVRRVEPVVDVAEAEKENLPSPGAEPASTSRRLEELSRERSKQKDLIHEMVMNKLLAEGKSPTDRRAKRNARGSFSPLGLNGLNQPGVVNGCEHLKVNNVRLITTSVPPAVLRNGLSQKEALTDEPLANQKLERTPTNENGVLSNDDVTPTNELPQASETTPQTNTFTNHSAILSKATPSQPNLFSSANHSTPVAFATPSSLFSTPMTSLRTRPLSVHSPASAYATPLYTGCLSMPSQSAPDIHGALMNGDEVFTTPKRPPRSKQDFQELRSSARARARQLSDSQLGLSPEEKLLLLKQKIATRRQVLSEADSNPAPWSLSPAAPVLVSSTTSSHKTTEETPAPLPSPAGRNKKPKDRERRKSLIQAVSEFFGKKSPPPSSSQPEATPPSSTSPPPPLRMTTTSTSSSSVKFKFPRMRHKAKDKASPLFCDHNLKPSLSESEIRRQLIDSLAPPIPPPPLNYRPTHLKLPSEDSLTDLDLTQSHLEDSGDADHLTAGTVTSSNVSTLSKKQSRTYRRLARQAQHKRLRMAQEIQRQLEELEVKQRELEAKGVEVEKMVRGEDTDVLCSDESTLLQRWYDLLRERSELARLERELSVRAQEIELEERHARLQTELKERMDRDEDKTEADVAVEGRLIQQMLDIVQQRNHLVSLLEADRHRYKEEDKDLEAQILTLKQSHHR